MHRYIRRISVILFILAIPNHSHGIELQTLQSGKYNYRLLIDTNDLILVTPDGSKNKVNSSGGQLRPNVSIVNRVTNSGPETLITLIDNTELLFYGSYLVQYKDPTGITNDLNYISDDALGHLHCESPEETHNLSCTSHTQFNFVPPFETSVTTQIDIRPPDCKSYFDDYRATRRGLQIERALKRHFQSHGYTPTPQTFPVIDFVEGNTAHIIKSRDLSKETFQAEDALYQQIIQDIEEIEQMFNEDTELSASYKNHSLTVEKTEIKRSVLNIVIQNGITTESQKTQIFRALNELKYRDDIALNIIEIP